MRIHGNMAVRTQRSSRAQASDVWTTTVTIKDGGQWRRAAVIATPITGAARPQNTLRLSAHMATPGRHLRPGNPFRLIPFSVLSISHS